jgi:hypothetical protein
MKEYPFDIGGKVVLTRANAPAVTLIMDVDVAVDLFCELNDRRSKGRRTKQAVGALRRIIGQKVLDHEASL